MPRFRPSSLGNRITVTAVAIAVGTVLVVYVYTVAIGGAASGQGAVKAQILVGGLFAVVATLGVGIYFARVASGSIQQPPGGRPQSRRRQLRNADPDLLGRPARPARAHLQRDAAPPRRARQRPQAVHRQRLARAAHADLQPRRLRRAARGGGPEPGGAGRVRPHDAPADRAADQAHRRPARPLPARRRRRGDEERQRRPRLARPRSHPRVRPARRPPRLAPGAAHARPSR